MTISVGDRLPEATLFEMTADGPAKVVSRDVFSGRTVAMFGVPGAFTPTCHTKHMPSFVDNADALRAKGVDEIVCLSVNDPFVTKAWGEATGATAKGIRILGDSDASFVKAMGLDFDGGAVGLGPRSRRFSMIVKDGTVAVLNVEETPSQAEATKAEKLIDAL